MYLANRNSRATPKPSPSTILLFVKLRERSAVFVAVLVNEVGPVPSAVREASTHQVRQMLRLVRSLRPSKTRVRGCPGAAN